MVAWMRQIIPLRDVLRKYHRYYSDLLKSIKDELRKLPEKGSVQGKKRRKRVFYYLAYRKDGKVRFDYLGKQRPINLIEQVNKRRKLRKQLAEIQDNLYAIGIARRANRLTIAQRFRVFERDNFTCRYCGRNVKEHKVVLSVDHILPKKRGGTDGMDNLATARMECNLGKHAQLYTELPHKI
jgi:hypothetical protein